MLEADAAEEAGDGKGEEGATGEAGDGEPTLPRGEVGSGGMPLGRGEEGGGVASGVIVVESSFFRDHMKRVVSRDPVTRVSSSPPNATQLTTLLWVRPPDP